MAEFQLGVSVEEAVANGLNTGSDVSTRNIGLLMSRIRGVANKPILITSPKEDSLIFGGFDSSMYSPYVVKNLFDNLSGFATNIFGVRIVGDGSQAAEAVISDKYLNDQGFVTTTATAAAVGVAQVNHVTPGSAIDIGDQFKVTMGSTTVTYTATVATVANVVAGVVAAIAAEKVAHPTGDFQHVTASNGTTKVIITADSTNTPFTQTSSTTNASTSNDIFQLKAGRQGEEDMGDWGNDLKAIVYPKNDPNGVVDNYLMQIYYKDVLVESYTAETWEDMDTQVNLRSNYVMMAAIDYGQTLTLAVQTETFALGTYVAPSATDFEPTYDGITGEPKGMAIFESVDVQLLVCPEVFSTSFATKCEAFAKDETKGKRVFVFSMPYLATETVLQAYNTALVTSDQSHAASFLPWVEVDDSTTGGRVWIPGVGYYLGAGFVRAAGLNDGRVWTPPAGTQTRAYGIYRFTHDTLTDQTLDRYAKQWHCNVVKYVKNTGYCIWSSRTYSSNSLYHSIHIRLLANWLIENFKRRGARFVQKLNTTPLRNEMKVDFNSFMRSVYNQGGLENSIAFDKCVEITVSTDADNRKNLKAEILYVPTETIEALKIVLSRNDGILSVQ